MASGQRAAPARRCPRQPKMYRDIIRIIRELWRRTTRVVLFWRRAGALANRPAGTRARPRSRWTHPQRRQSVSHLVQRAINGDRAVLHDDDAVCVVGDVSEIVGDNDDARSLVFQFGEPIPERRRAGSSRPVNCSSNTRWSGCIASAPAMASRSISPHESESIRSDPRPSSPTASSASATRRPTRRASRSDGLDRWFPLPGRSAQHRS